MQNKAQATRGLTSRGRQAQERASELARRVPWQVLLESRNQYLEWQEFYYWARSIMECEERMPDWLERRFEEVCPGFVESERRHGLKYGKDALAAIRLGEWIDKHVFAFAGERGWLPAITFYAVREPRYGKVSAHWSESVKNWRDGKPSEYPSFDEWRRRAERCDETAHLLPEIRKQRECFKLVEPTRLAQAVSRYIDWEAFAYWARAALEQQPLSIQVTRELGARCPGFAEFNAGRAARDGQVHRSWDRLMLWISDHFFPESKAEGWFDAILISARMHPRAIRTMEYADHCDDIWNGALPAPYPSFENWRRDADCYVDLANS